jgi:hypothetical protein
MSHHAKRLGGKSESIGFPPDSVLRVRPHKDERPSEGLAFPDQFECFVHRQVSPSQIYERSILHLACDQFVFFFSRGREITSHGQQAVAWSSRPVVP